MLSLGSMRSHFSWLITVRDPLPSIREPQSLNSYQSAKDVQAHILVKFWTRRPACHAQTIEFFGVPYRIRTGVAAVRGRCPGPLDEGDRVACSWCRCLNTSCRRPVQG